MTVAQLIDRLRQLVLEHPESSNHDVHIFDIGVDDHAPLDIENINYEPTDSTLFISTVKSYGQ